MASDNDGDVMYEGIIGYYSRKWSMYERKWMKVTNNKILDL